MPQHQPENRAHSGGRDLGNDADDTRVGASATPRCRLPCKALQTPCTWRSIWDALPET